MRRSGSCLGCGQHCCSTVVLPLSQKMARQFIHNHPVVAEPSGDPDYDNWLRLHGIDGTRVWVLPAFTRYSVIGQGDQRVPIATVPLPCHALSDDGSCSLYGSSERPRMCADWPWEPLQLKTMTPAGEAACGYAFHEEK